MAESFSFTNARGEIVDLSSAQYRVRQRSGAGLPEVSVYTRRAPFQRGTSFLAARAAPRRLTLLTYIKGDSYADRINLEYELARALNPELGPGKLTISTDRGVTRTLSCYCVGGLDFPADAQIGVVARRAVLSFEAPDPTFAAPAATTIAFSGQGGGLLFPQAFPWTFTSAVASVGSVYTLLNPGDVEAPPVITVQGPMLNPVLRNATTNQSLAFAYQVPSGATLTVDARFGLKTAVLAANGTETNLQPYLSGASEFWSLAAGKNNIIITSDGPTPGGTATLVYTPRYLSL